MPWPEAIAARVGDRRPAAVDDGQSGADTVRLHGDAGDLFLKTGRGHVRGLVLDEADRLRWLTGRVPAPRVVEVVEEGDAAWLLTTALPGVPAGAFIKADRARAVAVAQAMAAFLRQLHALPVADCPFDSTLAAWLPVVRRLVADGLVDTDDFDDEHGGWSAARVLAKVEELAGAERGHVVVHGDFSLGNIIVGDDGTITGCIDVGRLGAGDPYRDVFIGWRDLGGFGAAAQAAFLAALGIDALDPTRRELHRALDELF
ncbi:MAG: aminoglycoside 3'-phosphotransferase [Sphingomonas adhaesiva]|uniref:APH(3') family aminoglycoside O-phosphotransferase n=1 Tax=Sphingomonas adhaesiva TaxID=28212 RepID=UPI002FFCBC56